MDQEAEAVLRSVKSRAMYGEVKRRVDRVRSQPGHAAEAAANGQEKEKGGAVALYQAPDMMAGAARLGGLDANGNALTVHKRLPKEETV